jgi:hypothetical protein
MILHDYLIDQEGQDWNALLADWHWLLPAEFTIWMVNRFGDIFLTIDDGSVWMLDVGAGSLERVADNREHFCQLIDEADNAAYWLLIPVVDRLVDAGMTLAPGKCYSYTIPPVMGGKHEIGNVWVAPLHEHYGLLASIHDQIKDLPDGTQVRLTVKNRPDSIE